MIVKVLEGKEDGANAVGMKLHVLNKKYSGLDCWMASEEFFLRAKPTENPFPYGEDLDSKPVSPSKPSNHHAAKHKTHSA